MLKFESSVKFLHIPDILLLIKPGQRGTRLLITMFKYSICFATLAGLIFLLRGDDDGKQEKKRKVSRELTQDIDYDDYDEYEDFDYSDIDIDDLDYDTLKELEMTLSNMG